MTVTVPQQAKRVRYVYIPADVHEEIQERELDVPEGREVESLLDTLKEHFRRAGGTKTAAQREAHRQQLLQQVGADAASKLNEQMVAAALDMQMVETLPLLVNNPGSGYIGINLYCDDQAQVKELPPNMRASQIADRCGRPTQVRGDAFLARIFDNDDAFVRLDLGLPEVSSTAPWVAQAAAQAAERMRQGDRAADFMAKLQQQRAEGAAKATKPTATVRELTPAETEKEAGNAAVKAGDWATAVARYSAALEADPAMTAAANNRALALLRLGRPGEAERDCDKVLEAEPRNVKALLRRAAARAALGKTAEAAGDLRAVLEVEPHNKEAATELAKMAPPPPPPPPSQPPPPRQEPSPSAPGQPPAATAGATEGTMEGTGSTQGGETAADVTMSEAGPEPVAAPGSEGTEAEPWTGAGAGPRPEGGQAGSEAAASSVALS